MNQSSQRLEKRVESVRGLPQGQFDKYRQMFDPAKQTRLVPMREHQKSKSHTNLHLMKGLSDYTVIDEEDEEDYMQNKFKPQRPSMRYEDAKNTEKLQLEMNRIFDGVSNDTNSLINSLCANNLNIRDFISTDSASSSNQSDKSNSLKSVSSSTTDSISIIPLSHTQHSKKSKPEPTSSSSSAEWFQAIPVFNIYDDSNSAEESAADLEQDDNNVKSKPGYFTAKSLEDDLDFSDDSFDDIDNQETSEACELSIVDERPFNRHRQALSLPPVQSPPPKPARTFEHDIYMQCKKRVSSVAEEEATDERNGSEHDYEPYENLDKITLDKAMRTNPYLSSQLNLNEQSVSNKEKVAAAFSASKSFALSMPNLTQIEKSKKNAPFKPFNKLFNQLKKTLSRKSLNEPEVTLTVASKVNEPVDSNEDTFEPPNNSNNNNQKNDQIKNVILRRMQSNKQIYEKLRTKSHVYSDYMDESQEQAKMKALFDYCLIVGLREPLRNNTNTSKLSMSTDNLNVSDTLSAKTNPVIEWKWPDQIPNLNEAITEFCFPDQACVYDFKKSDGSEIFQFTLTNYDGSRTYGNCIKLMDKTKKRPLVFCIVSQVDAFEMYHTILLEIERTLSSANIDEVKMFMAAIYSKPMPLRGDSVLVSFGIRNKRQIVLDRNYDRRLQHINLSIILNLPYDLILKIFASIVSEKKLIFVSSRLPLLTNTIQAFEKLLYPFSWPHTFVPVLPSYLIEMCEAPTPYIVGLMKTCKHELLAKYKGVSDILIVDLDKQRCLQEEGTELNIIPYNLLKTFKTDLVNLSYSFRNRKPNTASPIETQNQTYVSLCMAFMKFFLSTVGNYRDFLVPVTPANSSQFNSDKYIFKSKDFVENADSKELKEFLEWFVHTQLFDVFITKKLDPDHKFGVMFDEEIDNMNEASNSDTIYNNNRGNNMRIKQLSNKKSEKTLVIYKF